jgi:hypothetical protein
MGASAAPPLDVAPASGPVGTTFAIRGTGFPPLARLTYTVIDPTGVRHPGVLSGAPRQANNMADANGNFVVASPWLAEPGEPAGVYTAVVPPADDPANVLASVAFTVTGPGGAAATPVPTPPAAGTLTITPPSGGFGTKFSFSGRGFAPDTTYRLQMIGPAGTVAYEEGETTNLEGRFALVVHPDRGDPVGIYTVRVLAADGTEAARATLTYTGEATTATVAARAQATATRAATPTVTAPTSAAPTAAVGALPLSGGGGRAPGGAVAAPRWVLGLGALLLLGGLGALRRRAR